MLAVEAGAVREIIAAQDATRIPGAPAAVRGLVNVRGTLVPVVNTAVAVGLPDAGSPASLVLIERHGRPVALAVDEVLDLVSVPQAALGDRAALPGVRPDVVRAVGTAAGQDFMQLATDALLEPLLP